MAGQGIRRREILRLLGTAATAATFPGFRKWGFACGHVGIAALSIRPATYQPQFFSAAEYPMIERLAKIIDASVFLNCTDKTTTISIMAFSLRTSEHLIENFRRGEHRRA
jgi:hypothetical protein